MNPMLLNAQLQALANPLLSGMYGSQFHPGLLQVQQAAATAERLRAMASGSAPGGTGSGSAAAEPAARPGTGHRYSPYPLPSPPTSSSLSLSSPTSTSSSSAFQAVKKSIASSEQGPVKSEANLTAASNADLKIPNSSPKTPPNDMDTSTSERQQSKVIGSGADHLIQTESAGAKSEIKEETTTQNQSLQHASDIKNMEKLVNGLNGSTASKFGISHNNNDQQISA